MAKNFKRAKNVLTSNATQNAIQLPLAKNSTQEIRKVADWLSPINFQNIQVDTFSQRTSGTGEWFLRHKAFQKWVAKDKGIFWVIGMPGAGKTILVSTIIHHLQGRLSQDTGTAILFAYFRYTDSYSPVDILASLVKQLVERCASLPPFVDKIYNKHKRAATHLSEDELLELFCHLRQLFTKVYVVMDALDEVSEDHRTKVLACLQSLSVDLLITSRPLKLAAVLPPDTVTITIDAQTKGDIELYAIEQLEKSPSLRQLLQGDKPLYKRILLNLQKKAKGMFLVIQLLVESLSKCSSKDALKSVFESLPTNLRDIYKVMLQWIQFQSTGNASLGMKALIWLIYAGRPLTIVEMQHALAISPAKRTFSKDDTISIEVMLSACCGLIVIDKKSKIIRLAHYTTYEFFSSLREGLFSRPHTLIATSCAVYLSAFGFQKLTRMTASTFDNFLLQGAFLEYAYSFWGLHAKKCYNEDGLPQSVAAFILSISKYPMQPASRQALDSEIEYFSPCHIAAYYGLIDVLESKQDSRSLLTSFGRTPLMLASERGHEAIVELILRRHGVDVNLRDSVGHTALHKASMNGQSGVVHLLLTYKPIKPNLDDRNGQTALWLASDRGHEKVVRRLLDQESVDVNLCDNRGHTPLHQASMYGQSGVVRSLLSHKRTKINLKNKEGQTALWLASSSSHESVVRFFLDDTRTDVNLGDFNGCTPLHAAAEKGRARVAQLLLAHRRTDINLRTNSGSTALHLASYHGCEEVTNLLLDQKEVHVSNTALHSASFYGHTSVVRSLLARQSIDVNWRDANGETALHEASKNGQIEVIHTLLSYREVNINAQDNSGLTALDRAVNKVVAQLLLGYGALGLNINQNNLDDAFGSNPYEGLSDSGGASDDGQTSDPGALSSDSDSSIGDGSQDGDSGDENGDSSGDEEFQNGDSGDDIHDGSEDGDYQSDESGDEVHEGSEDGELQYGHSGDEGGYELREDYAEDNSEDGSGGDAVDCDSEDNGSGDEPDDGAIDYENQDADSGNDDDGGVRDYEDQESESGEEDNGGVGVQGYNDQDGGYEYDGAVANYGHQDGDFDDEVEEGSVNYGVQGGYPEDEVDDGSGDYEVQDSDDGEEIYDAPGDHEFDSYGDYEEETYDNSGYFE